MRLKELVDKVEWKDVQDALKKAYPNEKRKNFEGYKIVLETLKQKRARKNKMRIFVTLVEDWFEKGTFYTSIDGQDGTTWLDEWKEHPEWSPEPDAESASKEISWAIEYRPWSSWLGMEIDPVSFEKYNEIEIVAHCLWEMTWAGFTEEKVQSQFKEINSSAKEVKKAIKDGTIDKITKPAKDVFAELNEEVEKAKKKTVKRKAKK